MVCVLVLLLLCNYSVYLLCFHIVHKWWEHLTHFDGSFVVASKENNKMEIRSYRKEKKIYMHTCVCLCFFFVEAFFADAFLTHRDSRKSLTFSSFLSWPGLTSHRNPKKGFITTYVRPPPKFFFSFSLFPYQPKSPSRTRFYIKTLSCFYPIHVDFFIDINYEDGHHHHHYHYHYHFHHHSIIFITIITNRFGLQALVCDRRLVCVVYLFFY